MDILSQSTITDELTRLLLYTRNYRTLIFLLNTNRLIFGLIISLVKQSYKNALFHIPQKDELFGLDWFLGSKRDREWDLPATIDGYGTKYWLQYGYEHRDYDLPAIVYRNGTKEWYQKGELYRKGDLPEIVWGKGKIPPSYSGYCTASYFIQTVKETEFLRKSTPTYP